jgi:GNAT superfamily N-acetyltransferase
MDETSRSVIRRATPTDAEAISVVLRAAFSEYEPCYTPEAFAATAISPAEVRQRMRDGPAWVALRGGGPVGMVVGTVAAVARGDALHIRGMAVVPTARGTGVGHLLLDAVVRFASRERYHRLTLCTTPFLTPAIRLYEQRGFRTTTEAPPEMPQALHGTPLITMARPVAEA